MRTTLNLARVGFVGTGWPDRVQIQAFRNAGLVPQGICSGQIRNAKRIAEKHNIPEIYDSWEALICSETIDLVSIATPTWLHHKIAIAALKAGKHVVCEAPTLTVEEAKEMSEVAKAHPNQLALIDYELRYTPQRQKMHQLIDSGKLGTLISIQLNYLFDWNLDSTLFWNWENDLESGGGVLNLVGGHLLDQTRWFCGSIEKLTAQFLTVYDSRTVESSNGKKAVTGDDQVTILLQSKNGVRGILTASAVHPDKNSSGLTAMIHASEGGLMIDKNEELWQFDKNGNPQQEIIADSSRKIVPQEVQSAFAYGTYHFANELKRVLVEGEKPSPDFATFYDGLIAQKAIEAARRSAKNASWEYVE